MEADVLGASSRTPLHRVTECEMTIRLPYKVSSSTPECALRHRIMMITMHRFAATLQTGLKPACQACQTESDSRHFSAVERA